ncbi:outer membrane protein OmpA-like peptidoglycan-associated protein [Sphingopyxis panaciterrae]|uniref:OmpA family protein n=1 Tax=Sphingopyxis panaciterrae TaxID=363841 RepID=UPI0014217038|nr:OmpA family protein [Sphingopyxis panaciterrae]NIJ36507.1 outer membrane protein OmpA-like peptidoglycan-associated protein [Sphingopyxis panaciterrae]
MRATLVLIGGLMLVAGCSDGEDAADTGGKNGGAATASTASAGAGNRPAPGGTMKADVSALAADTSGLEVRITDMGTIIDLPSDTLFDFDKATLTAAAEVELAKAAEMIRRAPPGAIEVIGHTDSKGEDDYNRKLSEARAKTVAEWFGRQVGVRQREFRVSGKGEAAPIAANAMADGVDDPAGRAKNRRVEVLLPAGASSR